jgi:hypothetical protein
VEISKEEELRVGHKGINEDVTKEQTLVETSVHNGYSCILGCDAV